jgi:phage terminase small subunit
MTKKLKAKHEVFCREFLVDLNATQAVIRAGYSAKRAHVTGAELYGR